MLITSWAVGAGLFWLAWAFEPSRPGVNFYPALSTAGVVAISCGNLLTGAWWAYRSSGLWTGVLAIALFGLAMAVAVPFAYDAFWLLDGSHLPRRADSCLGGMDCINETLPEVPLTGDGRAIVCLGWLTTLAVLAAAFDRRGREVGSRGPSAPVGG